MTSPAHDPLRPSLAGTIDRELPQTQCTRCGYVDCAAYAQAIADADTPINQCPPGGAEGIGRLAAILNVPMVGLNPAFGVEQPRRRALIDEAWCIGCTLCLQACPVDCILGGPKAMHTVIDAQCTGCELCLPACPVDCITMEPASGQATGWRAWSRGQAETARERYRWHRARLRQNEEASVQRLRDASPGADQSSGAASPPSKQATIAAALARARSVKSA